MRSVETQLRRLTPADHDAIFAVARHLAAWFRPIDQLALAIDLVQHEGFVARHEQEDIGFVTFHVIGDDVAEISWLGVHPDRQGVGVGSALLAVLEKELRRRGIVRVQVSTVAESADEPAFAVTWKFYAAHDFQQVRYDRDFYSRGRHRVLLEKQL